MTTPVALDMVTMFVASAPGTGTISLGTVVPFGGLVDFAHGGAVDGGSYYYYIQDGNNREFGWGVYSASALTLTRNTVTASVGGVQQNTPINATANAIVSSMISNQSTNANLAAALDSLYNIASYVPAATLNTSGADITSYLNAAISAMSARGGGTLIFPPLPSGVAYWTISSTITIPTNVRLVGAGSAGIYGSFGSYLMWGGASGGTMFSIGVATNNAGIIGFNLNGNNIAARLIDCQSVRFSEIRKIWGAGFTGVGIGIYGTNTSGDLNFMNRFDYLYLNTTTANAICLEFDGVLSVSTDSWLTTFRNCRFESTGAGGICIRLGFSDNILWSQIHCQPGFGPIAATGNVSSGSNSITSWSGGSPAVGMYINAPTLFPAGTKITGVSGSTITVSNNASGTASSASITLIEGAGLLFDASTAGTAGNNFPTGHQFDKCAIQNTATLEDSTHTIGVSTFLGFGTTDNEVIPTHPNLRGVTDQGVAFNNYLISSWSSYTPTATINGATGTISATGNYQQVGKTVVGNLQISLSTNSAATSIGSSLPTVAAANACIAGIDSTGKTWNGRITSGSSAISIFQYDGTVPLTSLTLAFTFAYQSQ